MAIISEIKCSKCDKKYSGVRSRCPYCGARRIGRGKYSEDGDSNKGKMLICILILAVMTVAVGALLLTTPMPEGDIEPPGLNDQNGSNLPSEEDTFTIPGIGVPHTPEPIEEPTVTPEPMPIIVESLTITYDGRRREDITLRVGERVPLGVRIEPAGIELEDEIEWLSSDSNFFDVVPIPERTRATVTGVGVGTGTLIVRVGDIEATCIVRVRAR